LLVESGVFGRTNQVFPATWLRLIAAGRENADIAELAKAAQQAKTVIDISSNAALWGGFLRATTAPIMAVGPFDLSRAAGEQSAHDLVLAHLIETLSAVGRESIDFYFLRVDAPLRENQISGALIALEEARQESNVKFVGMAAYDSMSAQTLFHFHDAFEAILLSKPSEQSALRLMAKERRVAIVSAGEIAQRAGEARLVSVASESEVRQAMQEAVPA